jgi:hypothetical protein
VSALNCEVYLRRVRESVLLKGTERSGRERQQRSVWPVMRQKLQNESSADSFLWRSVHMNRKRQNPSHRDSCYVERDLQHSHGNLLRIDALPVRGVCHFLVLNIGSKSNVCDVQFLTVTSESKSQQIHCPRVRSPPIFRHTYVCLTLKSIVLLL